MTGTRARPPAGGPELTDQEAAEYMASLLDGLRQVAHSAQMPFLASLINVRAGRSLQHEDQSRLMGSPRHSFKDTSCCP